jgi:FtsP/CotA-like multicopper oxidase with cupredoxin domain
MFVVLYVVHHITSGVFAACVCIAMAMLARPHVKREWVRSLWMWTSIAFGVLTVISAGLLYFSYTWQLVSTWAIVAAAGWLTSIGLLVQNRRKWAVVSPFVVTVFAAPLAIAAGILSMEQSSLLSTIEIVLYTAVGAGGIWAWRHVGASGWRKKWLAKVAIGGVGSAGMAGVFLVHQHLSYLPGVMSMNMSADEMQMMPGVPMTSVADYAGPRTAHHVARFNLVASEQTVQLGSGSKVAAWTFGGTSPRPTLRVTEGDLVEVTVTNRLPEPTTIHWHGIDLPNAEDGVAGVTQDAIMPGKTFTYRFIAKDAGTHWYHSHQEPATQIPKGLYGTVVVTPKQSDNEHDQTVAIHTWQTSSGKRLAFNTADTLDRKAMKPGTLVHLRITNTDSNQHLVQLLGTPFKVVAIDGRDITKPSVLHDERIEIAAGGRVDLVFTMPASPVQLGDPGHPDGSAILFSPDGTGQRITAHPGAPLFDMMSYGAKTPGALTVSSHFDKVYDVNADQYLGFYDGEFADLHNINGKLLPHTKMLTVKTGDVVKLTYRNRTIVDHPMHLHGHHFTVLSHNGRPYTGSALRLDSLQTKPGDTWEVAFVADNPGMWMSHCHNLNHAAKGMDMMISYENVMTPYTFGPATPNQPE